MGEFKFRKLSVAEHDEFVLGFRFGNYFQSSFFAKERAPLGYSDFLYVDIEDEKGELCGANLLTLKKVPKVDGYYGYSRLGFVLDYDRPDWKDAAKVLWEETLRAAKEKKVIYFRFDLPLNVTEDRTDVLDFYKNLGAGHKGLFDNNDPYTFFRFRHSLDIKDPIDEVFKEIPRKTRWMINRAKKYHFVIEENAANDVDIYYKLKNETAIRNNIGTLSYDEDKVLIDAVKESGGYTLSVKLDLDKTLEFCRKDQEKWVKNLKKEEAKDPEKQNENKIKDFKASIEKLDNQMAELEEFRKDNPDGIYLSSCVVLKYANEVEYYKAASSSSLRDYYPNYLMLWTVMERAKEEGFEIVDLGGTFPDNEETGLGHFKRKWGGVTKAHSGDFDYVSGGLKGKLFRRLMIIKEGKK